MKALLWTILIVGLIETVGGLWFLGHGKIEPRTPAVAALTVACWMFFAAWAALVLVGAV